MDLRELSIDRIGLSVRASNVLRRAGIQTVSHMLECTEAQLLRQRNAGVKTAKEILTKSEEFRQALLTGTIPDSVSPEALFLNAGEEETRAGEQAPEGAEWSQEPAMQYARLYDCRLEDLVLSIRSLNCLRRAGYKQLSDILFLPEEKVAAIRNLGAVSLQEILLRRREWLELHEEGLKAAIRGDENALRVPPPGDDELKKRILLLYSPTPYTGLSLSDLTKRLPANTETNQIKRCVGALLAEGKLEYVDYRVYRVYPSFAQALASCPVLPERDRAIVMRRLEGETLVEAGRSYGLTRERVRQIVNKVLLRVRNWHKDETGLTLFDEDYYRSFYTTYSFDRKAAVEWLGLSPAALCYLELVTDRHGTRELSEAAEDQTLDTALRQKIRNYLNREKLWLNGQWVPKKRSELERYVVEHFCRENTEFDTFVLRYNTFLEEQGVGNEEKLQLDKAVYRTRKARLAEARYLLWKQGEVLRAYDVDGRDYTELFTGLGLDELRDIEISTQKLTEEYPELLSRYDIRDHYELHNLLRKVLPEGSFHDFRLERTPNIRFGRFDRDAALFELMVNNAPISLSDLAELIHWEYGYDVGVTISTYLAPLNHYYHQGYYTADQKVMSPMHQRTLLSALDGYFYFISELKAIYAQAVPEGDPKEINPYNLKQLGFTILSRYALRGFNSLEAFFRAELTREEQQDITPLRRRFTAVGMFSQTLMTMKRSLEVVEYEPNKLILFSCLEKKGLSRTAVAAFCESVWRFTEEGQFFTARSLRRAGLDSPLYALGFSDWFYASLLLSDPRFSYEICYKTIVLRRGTEPVTIRAFETALIHAAGSIGVSALQRELEETYGCTITDRLDLIYKVSGSGIFHDRYADRLYDSEERYWRELDGEEAQA